MTDRVSDEMLSREERHNKFSQCYPGESVHMTDKDFEYLMRCADYWQDRCEQAERDRDDLAAALRVAFRRGFGEGHGEHDYDEFCEIYGLDSETFDRLIAKGE